MVTLEANETVQRERKLIPHLCLSLYLKLFLDMVPSSLVDVTTTSTSFPGSLASWSGKGNWERG